MLSPKLRFEASSHILWLLRPVYVGLSEPLEIGFLILRLYSSTADPNQKKRKEEMPVYEQTENLENPLRCPVKLYEFYLSKW